MSALFNTGGPTGMTRRGFLVAMTLAGLSFGFPRGVLAAMDPATTDDAALPSEGAIYEPSVWYSIDNAGKVKVKVNIIRVEMGQHVGYFHRPNPCGRIGGVLGKCGNRPCGQCQEMGPDGDRRQLVGVPELAGLPSGRCCRTGGID